MLIKKEMRQVENDLVKTDFDLRGSERIAEVFIKGAKGAAFQAR